MMCSDVCLWLQYPEGAFFRPTANGLSEELSPFTSIVYVDGDSRRHCILPNKTLTLRYVR